MLSIRNSSFPSPCRMLSVVLAMLTLLASKDAMVSSIKYSHKAILFDDPEPLNPQNHIGQTNLNTWKSPHPGSDHIGLMFAGRTEYNWIADIRIQKQDQEVWSIGNIISSQHILTTCKAVKYFEELTNGRAEVKIHYCTLYLWEEFKHFDIKHRVVFDIRSLENEGDLRHAVEFMKYPHCSESPLKYDAAVVIVNKNIPTYHPFIGYMPIARDGSKRIIGSIDLLDLLQGRRICYVASFGRNYVDRQNHLVVDYKVKLRVYHTEWSKCRGNFPMICPNETACSKTAKKEKSECFTVRARVGSVCDHDRGAPLVCDQQVYGLVIRGALYPYCNTVWHLPFVVMKISHLQMFHKYFGNPSNDNPRYISLTDNRQTSGFAHQFSPSLTPYYIAVYATIKLLIFTI